MKFKIAEIDKRLEGTWFKLIGADPSWECREKGINRYIYMILVEDAEKLSEEQVKRELTEEAERRYRLQTKWEGVELEIKEEDE